LLYLIFNLSGTQLTKEEKYLKVKFPYDTLVQGIDMSTKKMVFWCIFLVFLLGTLEKEQFICFAHSSDSNVMSTDLNGDGVVDMRDIAIIAKAYDSYLGGANWNREADLNNDGVINILDFVLIAKDFGMKMSCDNFAVIPDDWRIGETWCAPTFLDYSVLHNGHPSIRMEKGSDPSKPREILAADKTQSDWCIRVKPGDHIVFKVWMKTSASTIGDNSPYSGVRCGIDFYAPAGDGTEGTYITGTATPYGETWTPSGGFPVNQKLNYVNWGSDWQQRTMDFIVQNQYYTDPFTSNPGQLMTPDRIIPWIQVWSDTYGNADNGIAWFADAELYINPP